MKKAIYCLLAILCPLLNLFAQPKTEIRQIVIGQTVPAITFPTTVNNNGIAIRLLDYDGRIIIIDFFATWCSGCIAELPKLDSLQKKFGDRIQIIVSTLEPAAKVTAFLSKSKKWQNISLPFVTADSSLGKMFPHKLIPHEVWLDGKRQVRAITQADEVNETNINRLLQNAAFSLPLKKDITDFDRDVNLLTNGNGGDEKNILYRSTIAGQLDGLGGMIGRSVDTVAKTQRTFYVNCLLRVIYMDALGRNFAPNLIVYNVPDSSKPANVILSNNLKNIFSYEQIVPLGMPKAKQRAWMLQDLDRYFSLHVSIEKRKVPCYVLVKAMPAEKMVVKNTAALERRANERHQTLKSLIEVLNSKSANNTSPIFIDGTETGLDEAPLYDPMMQDVETLKKILATYGINITMAEREVDMLIINGN